MAVLMYCPYLYKRPLTVHSLSAMCCSVRLYSCTALYPLLSTHCLLCCSVYSCTALTVPHCPLCVVVYCPLCTSVHSLSTTCLLCVCSVQLYSCTAPTCPLCVVVYGCTHVLPLPVRASTHCPLTVCYVL